MIQLPTNIHPPQDILDGLNLYQLQIVGTFSEKKALAKSKNVPGFSSRNKKGNQIFEAVKVSLTAMCSGAKRCAYCEDALADEVEHIYPKDLYPDRCFDWHNYLYACGTCNGPKKNQFAIFNAITGELQHLDGTIQPPQGTSVLINPRRENAMDFCRLNFRTFHFEIIEPTGTTNYQRADYTINTVLRLNIEREYLRQARENAYGMYKTRLYYYTHRKRTAPQTQLDNMIRQLKKEAHPSVWKEMQRSYNEARLQLLDNDLYELFQQSPEALTW